MLIAVVNESSLVSNDEVSLMTQAIQTQLNLHFCPAYNQKPIPVKFYSDENKVPGYSWVIHIINDDKQVEGALGFHEEEKSGRIDGYIMCEPILSNGGAVMLFDPKNPAQYTVSATLSHEILEVCGNEYCSGFFDRGDGVLIAAEVSDPVEQISFQIEVNGTPIAVSDFVFPSYWNPRAKEPINGPFNYLKTLHEPFSMLPGGYQIQMRGGNERQVFGEAMPMWRRETKQKAFSRGRRLCSTK
jgi:hypothetical protein